MKPHNAIVVFPHTLMWKRVNEILVESNAAPVLDLGAALSLAETCYWNKGEVWGRCQSFLF